MNSSIILVALLCSIVTALPAPIQNLDRPLIDRIADEGKKVYSVLEKQHPSFLPYKTIFDGIEADRVAKRLPGVSEFKDYEENVLELLENALDYAEDSAPTNIPSEEVYQFAKTFTGLIKEISPVNPKLSKLMKGIEIIHSLHLSYGYKNDATSVDNFHSLIKKAAFLKYNSVLDIARLVYQALFHI